MSLDNAGMSCGVAEFYNLYDSGTDPKNLVRDVWDYMGEAYLELPFVLFSDTSKLTSHHNFDYWGKGRTKFTKAHKDKAMGTVLAEYIKKRRLGTVTVTTNRKNPATGHTIKVWIWSINWSALRKLAKEEGWGKFGGEDEYGFGY